MKTKTLKQRTHSQNRAMHLFFQLLSDELNTQGIDMKAFLKPSWDIWWTPEALKSNVWKPLQKAMFQKESTADLDWSEVSDVYDQLMKIIGEKYGISVDFPSDNWEQEMRDSGITYHK